MTTSPLPPRETLTVDFKSDRKRLSDTNLVEAVICLANAEGGHATGCLRYLRGAVGAWAPNNAGFAAATIWASVW